MHETLQNQSCSNDLLTTLFGLAGAGSKRLDVFFIRPEFKGSLYLLAGFWQSSCLQLNPLRVFVESNGCTRQRLKGLGSFEPLQGNSRQLQLLK